MGSVKSILFLYFIHLWEVFNYYAIFSLLWSLLFKIFLMSAFHANAYDVLWGTCPNHLNRTLSYCNSHSFHLTIALISFNFIYLGILMFVTLILCTFLYHLIVCFLWSRIMDRVTIWLLNERVLNLTIIRNKFCLFYWTLITAYILEVHIITIFLTKIEV